MRSCYIYLFVLFCSRLFINSIIWVCLLLLLFQLQLPEKQLAIEIFSYYMWCELTALSVSHICESRGANLTGNKASERNVSGKSHRHWEVPGKCICHIHEGASGAAAETRHLALGATEALLGWPHPPTPPLQFVHMPSPLPSRLTPGCRRGAAAATQRCNLLVRSCQIRSHFGSGGWRAGRSIRCRTPAW